MNTKMKRLVTGLALVAILATGGAFVGEKVAADVPPIPTGKTLAADVPPIPTGKTVAADVPPIPTSYKA